jgi:hypothetical protein
MEAMAAETAPGVDVAEYRLYERSLIGSGSIYRKLCQWSVESPINCVAFVPMEEFADDEEMFFMVGPAGHISSRRIPLCNNGINDKLAHGIPGATFFFGVRRGDVWRLRGTVAGR